MIVNFFKDQQPSRRKKKALNKKKKILVKQICLAYYYFRGAMLRLRIVLKVNTAGGASNAQFSKTFFTENR
jgi:hypothetical protein